jgi:ADP-ribose pyrophosphatase YjhB (NUDIX family)
MLAVDFFHTDCAVTPRPLYACPCSRSVIATCTSEARPASRPAGTVRDGEPPSETAVREAREETGLDVRLVRQLGVRAAVDHEQHFFHVELTGRYRRHGTTTRRVVVRRRSTRSALFWLPIPRARQALDFGLGDYLEDVTAL